MLKKNIDFKAQPRFSIKLPVIPFGGKLIAVWIMFIGNSSHTAHLSLFLYLHVCLCLKCPSVIFVLFVETNVSLYCSELCSIWQRGDLGPKAGL